MDDKARDKVSGAESQNENGCLLGCSEGELTAMPFRTRLYSVQLTIEIPDGLAEQLEAERDRLAAILARGLRRSWSPASPVRREVISFLARRPTAQQILDFRPSAALLERSRELLQRAREGRLTPEEEAELDEMCDIDRMVSLIKAEVLTQSSSQA